MLLRDNNATISCDMTSLTPNDRNNLAKSYVCIQLLTYSQPKPVNKPGSIVIVKENRTASKLCYYVCQCPYQHRYKAEWPPYLPEKAEGSPDVKYVS